MSRKGLTTLQEDLLSQVRDEERQTLVDLVWDQVSPTVPVSEKPLIDGLRIEPLRELRANKLAAILGRGETKDLLDLYFLQRHGYPAMEGLEDAAAKDGGLDPSTLAWVLSSMYIDLTGLMLEAPLKLSELQDFRDGLVLTLQEHSWPGHSTTRTSKRPKS